MKIRHREDADRRIGTSAHNKFVADGIAVHSATQVAPPDLLRPFPELLGNQLRTSHEKTEKTLRQLIGKPFFSENGFILYQGDCVEFLRKLGAGQFTFNLTVTSPPYNIGKQYEESMAVQEYVSWCSTWMQLLHDVAADNGSFWLNLGYLEVPKKGLCVPISYLLWDKSQFYLLQEIVWTYGAGVSAKHRLSPRNEKWLYYVKDVEKYTFNLDDIRDPNVKYPNQRKNGKFRCNPHGKNPTDVWEIPKVTTGAKRSSKERTLHPAQFPLRVLERIVKASSNPGDLVLDPFAGSCSAGVCATGLGRIFVGFEARKDYCEMAVERFKAFQDERREAERQRNLI